MEIKEQEFLYNISQVIKILVVALIGGVIVYLLNLFSILYINKGTLNNFTTILFSIILEGLPFIILGSFISSLIQVFVSEERLARLIPKNKLLGTLIAASIGLFFPVCECAIVPIVRRLIKKGLPLNMAVTFMLAVPIINPIVLASTYYAFLGKPYMVCLRAGFGIVCAMIIGYLASILQNNNPLKYDIKHEGQQCSCGHHSHEHHHHEHCHEHENNNSKWSEIIGHTNSEVYDVGKLFIIGAFLAAILQTFIPRQLILSIGSGNLSSIIVMMTLAFVLSICSETDAFIARTFLNQFTTGSIVGFLILGPMIDIKNTIMLSGNFKLGFVIKLLFLIISVCFLAAVVVGFIPSWILGI
jgi:uncharacterized membrane protein YraQ (UPF0718 family)